MITSEHGKVVITGEPQEYITDALLVVAQAKTQLMNIKDEDTRQASIFTLNSTIDKVIKANSLDELIAKMVGIIISGEGEINNA